MNRKFLIQLVSVLSALSVLVAQKEDSLIKFLPEDTLVAMEIDNWEDIQDDLESGPWGEIMDFPIWEKVKDKIENELGRGHTKKSKSNLEEIRKSVFEPMMDSIEGGIVLGISDLANLMEREMIKNDQTGASWRAQKMPFFALILDSSLGDDDFNEIISTLEDLGSSKMQVIEEKMGEVSLRWFLNSKNEELTKLEAKSTGLCASLHKGKFFLVSGDKERVESVFTTFFDRGKSLKDNESYIDCFDEIGMGQARLFFNFKEGMRVLREQSEKMKIPQNPFGIETSGLIDGLGLNGLNHLGVCLDAKSKEFEMGSSLGMDHREGILSFLSTVKGDLGNHDFVSKDVFTVSNGKNDLGQLWPKMENILKGVSPALHLLVTTQIQAFEDQSDVRIRTDLLGSLGDEMVSLSYLHQDNLDLEELASPSSSIYAISLRNAKLFDRTMRAMVDSVSQGNDLFEENEHRGVTIRSMRGLQGAGLSISYAISEGWLLLSMGEDRYLKQVINRMNNGKNSLWDSAHVQNALNDLPRGIRQVDYVDVSKMFSFFEVMFEAIDDDEFDFTSDDFGDFPYFLLGWSKDTDTGFVSKAKLYPFSE